MPKQIAVVSILPKDSYDASLDIIAKGDTIDEAIKNAVEVIAINSIDDYFVFEDVE